jgi:hypothetical protein
MANVERGNVQIKALAVHLLQHPRLPKSINQVVAPAIVTPPSASIPLMS